MNLVRVEATGPAGNHPATWGQASQYLSHVKAGTGDALMLRFVLEIPPAYTLDQVLSAVRTSVGAFDSLRTTLAWQPAGTGLVQMVHGTASVEVTIDEHADKESARRSLAKEQVDTVRLEQLFDHPLNLVTIACAGSRPTFLIWRVPHVFVDGWSIRTLRDALRQCLTGEAAVEDLAQREQPRERAAREAANSGRRTSTAAVEYWRRTVTRYHERDWPQPPAGPAHTYSISLRAVTDQLERVAAQHSVGTSVVLIACVGTAICAVSGAQRLVLQADWCNRYVQREQESVSCLVQPAFIGIEPGAAASAGALITMVQDSTMRAYRHAQYEPFALKQAVAAAEATDGRSYRTPLCFNDMRGPHLRRAAQPPLPAGHDDPDVVSVVGSDEADGYSDLYVWPRDDTDGLTLRLRTAENRFSREASVRLLTMVPHLIRQLTADRYDWSPSAPVPGRPITA